MNKPTLYFISYKNLNIYSQLQKEEALLRLDKRNICLFNEGSKPAIVLGISGDPEELIDQELLEKRNIPLIRRFSGGGTVVVDEETLFVTFIFNKEDLNVEPYPKNIFEWSQTIYEPLFNLEFKNSFNLRENDYVLGDKKFGGNAQYVSKERWLHHTSLLFDYKEEQMKLLKMPKKTPHYRQNRPHDEFLCKLKSYFVSKEVFFKNLSLILEKKFELKELSKQEVEAIVNEPHRKATKLLKIPHPVK